MIDGTSCFMILPLAFNESIKKDKRTLSFILTGTILTVTAIIVSFAVYVGSALSSPDIPQMVNLAFKDYAFGSQT
jgi:hypothetical protein